MRKEIIGYTNKNFLNAFHTRKGIYFSRCKEFSYDQVVIPRITLKKCTTHANTLVRITIEEITKKQGGKR